MKIGIFTFHRALNYGAVLQAYAMQEFLKTLGHDAYLIEYIHDFHTIRPPKNDCCKMDGREILFYLKTKIRSIFSSIIRSKREARFGHFVNNYLKISTIDINSKDNDFDAFIFGSDQIWNPIITNGISPFFIGMVPATKNKRLISYAASVGSNENISNNSLDILCNALNKFHSISVREKSLSALLQEKLVKNIPIVLDPVLLLGINHFYDLCKAKSQSSPYLFFFTLSRDEYAIEYAYKIAKLKGLEVVEAVSSIETLKYRNIKQLLAPTDFVNYIKNASYVVTTSYHAMIFSILFERNFNYVYEDLKVVERAISIMEDLGIQDRIIKAHSCKDVIISDINYQDVTIKLQALQKKSRDFMIASLYR